MAPSRIAPRSAAAVVRLCLDWSAIMRAMWCCVTCAVSCAMDARELRFARAGEHQAIVQEHEAARHGERVDAVVLDHEVLEVPASVGTLRSEPLPHRIHVLADFRVLEQRVWSAQLVRHHRPEAYSSVCERTAAAGLPMSGRSEPAAGVRRISGVDGGHRRTRRWQW